MMNRKRDGYNNIVFFHHFVIDDFLNDCIFSIFHPIGVIKFMRIAIGCNLVICDAQDGSQVETEAIDVHFFGPEMYIIEDESMERPVIRASLVSDARLIEIIFII